MKIRILIIALIACAATAHAATRTAASCSSTDINAQISLSANGDTVLVPAGTCSYASTLAWTKAIIVLGCGSPDYPGGCAGTTTINNNHSGTATFQISNTGANFARISGFTFTGSNSSSTDDSTTVAINIFGPATKVRVDHSTFTGYDCNICVNYFSNIGAGPVAGVADHDSFVNSGRGFFAQDGRTTDGSNPGSVAWGEFIGNEINYAGANNQNLVFYFEDDTWISNRAIGGGYGQSAVYGQYGGKVVIRNSTLNNFSPEVDAHGDNPGYGTIYYEIYNNVIHEDCTHTGFGCQGVMSFLRGGQHIFHDNTFTGVSTPVSLTVYFSSDLQAHRIHNSYFWNNTWNGSSCQADGNEAGAACVTIAPDTQGPLTRNSNYWLRAPTQPSDVYFGYSTLSYPHPLVSGGAPQILTSISLAPSSATLNVGGASLSLIPTCLDQNSATMTCPTLSWTSSATSIASVAGGVVTPLSIGTTNITATSGATTSTPSVITVTSFPAGVIPVGPSDCSAATVNAAIASAVDGNTVLLTCSGSINWAATGTHGWAGADNGTTSFAVNIPATKGITLQVQNANNSDKAHPVFPLTVTLPANVQAVVLNIGTSNSVSRVSGFKFQQSGGSVDGFISIVGAGIGKSGLGGYRVDNNYFNGISVWDGVIGVWSGRNGTTGNLFGLIDNNTFFNIWNSTNATFGPYVIQLWNWWHPASPAGNTCWGCDGWTNNDFTYGSSANNFIESNLFDQEASASGHIRHFISSELGARYVSRFNTFVNNFGDQNADLHDAHGTCIIDSSGMGSRGGEIYGNTIQGTGYNRFTQLRGGSWLVYNNTITPGGGNPVELNEYRAEASSANQCTPVSTFPTCPTANPMKVNWPVPSGASWINTQEWCSDVTGDAANPGTKHPLPQQIFNTYTWNNKNASTSALINPVVPSDGAQTRYIISNSDFFASSSQPAALAGYAPYPFPNPLAGSTPPPIPAPSGVSFTMLNGSFGISGGVSK